MPKFKQRLLVTGSGGLIGAEAVRYFARQGFQVHGLDNNLRQTFFGPAGSTAATTAVLCRELPRFRASDTDIRDRTAVNEIFRRDGPFDLVIHTAAQPSHDWAARLPLTDFDINAVGTANLLEATRQRSPEAVFIFTSTNKVYGDRPNLLPVVEQETRWELPLTHPRYTGVNEDMSLDASLHSVFGASKTAADILVQEYGRYFGLRTACFRCGCLTGPRHRAVELHGFLQYLVQCVVTGRPYRIHGYKGKQVRDNIHSYDLIRAFDAFYQAPRCGAVYNLGGSRHSHCSLLEAVAMVEDLCGRRAQTEYGDQPRRGDHIWYVSDVSRFRADYPGWAFEYDLDRILEELVRSATDGQAVAA